MLTLLKTERSFLTTQSLPDVSLLETCVSECQELIINLFKKANSSLQMNPEEDHDIYCRKLVDRLSKDSVLGKGIKDKKDDSKTLRPHISKKELYEQCKAYLPVHHGLSLDEMVKRIKEQNKTFQMMGPKAFFGRENPSKQREGWYQKAIKLQFFLNCDEFVATPEKWIPNLV